MWKWLFVFLLVSGLLFSFLNTLQSDKKLRSEKKIEKKFIIPPPLQAFAQQYQKELYPLFQSEAIPAMAVAIVKDSFLLHEMTWGVNDLSSPKDINPNTVFRIASLSKGFAPVLTAMLIEDSLLHWDHTVISYLPSFQLSDSIATQELSLRHVLSHTTGLPRHTYSNLLNMEVPYQDILKQLPEVTIAHPVGTYYNYQNVAYCLIGDVLEKKMNISYEQLLKQYIFMPLQMNDISTSFEALQKTPNLALPHKVIENGYTRKELENTYYDVTPAAGINASLKDMEKWLLLLLGNYPHLINQSSLDEIFTPFIPISTKERHFRAWKPLESASYALGWRILERNGRKIIWHSGYVNGYRGEIALDQASRFGIVLLSNASSQTAVKALPLFFDHLDRMEKDTINNN